MSGTELAIVLVAVVAGSVAKAVTGMGLPIIAIPIAALFVDLDDAVVTLALPNVVANGVLAYRERTHFGETRDLPTLAVAGIAGATVGAIAFVSLPEQPLVIILIVAIVAYVVTFFAKPDLKTSPEQSRRLAPGVGFTAGAFQGAIGISGPIVGSWIHSYRLPRGAHILSVTSLFLMSGGTQLTVFAATGELSGRAGATVLACLPVLASIPVGTWLRGRVSARGFDLTIVAMLIASIGALAVKSFT
ncbi:MAG: sulfite exporter TauE/SafE family protein [Ilumatobacter sp.]